MVKCSHFKIILKPTSCFHLAKVTSLHVICISLSFTRCSIPCLMNINVKSLVSEVTTSLYRSQCTENLHNSDS